MSFEVDRLSLVVSPRGLLDAATAANGLWSMAMEPMYMASGAASDTRSTPAQVRQVPIPPQVPFPLRPAVTTAVQTHVGELRSMLSLESRPLASLSVRGLEFEACKSEWWERSSNDEQAISKTAANFAPAPQRLVSTGWPGWSFTMGHKASAMRYVRMRIHGVGMLDLTTDGQLHHEVISHAFTTKIYSGLAASGKSAMDRGFTSQGRIPRSQDRSFSYSTTGVAPTTGAPTASPERMPVVVLEFIPALADGRRGAELNISVRGLRVCYLRRFMAEVIKYFGPDGLGPVFDVAQNLWTSRTNISAGAGAGADVGGSGSDADNQEEKVAVVVGEEDVALPDDWSVVSSGSRGATHERNTRQKPTPDDENPGRRGVDDYGRGGENDGAKALSGDGAAASEGGAAAMRLTAILEDFAVLLPRNTHSREAAALRCEELILEVRWRFKVLV